MEFQKRLLSAGYIKQHWLFLRLTEKYVDFAIQLANVDPSLKEPFIVKTFQFDKFMETSLIPADFPSRVITIRNLSSLHYFAMANIKILTHAVSLLVNSDELLMKKCTGAVLQCFDVMDFRIKTLALKFLIEETVHRNYDYCRAVTQLLLQSFDTLNSRIDQWNVAEDVNEFDRILSQFLCDERNLSNFCELTDDCAKLFDFCLALIERRRDIRGSNYEHLIAASYQRLRVILMKHLTTSLTLRINEFVVKNQNITTESLKLLEYCVLDECKAADSSFTWAFGCELLEDILNQCECAQGMEEIRGESQFSSAMISFSPFIDFCADCTVGSFWYFRDFRNFFREL